MWQKIKRIFENKKIKFVTKVIYLKCDEIGSASIEKNRFNNKNEFWDIKLINKRAEKERVNKFLCISKYI